LAKVNFQVESKAENWVLYFAILQVHMA